MKKLIFLISITLFVSCSDFQHPDYERNLEITKQWFDVFVTEDLDATMDFYAGNVEYQSAFYGCLLYTSPSPRDATLSRMPSSA